jgi:hypothetical protein
VQQAPPRAAAAADDDSSGDEDDEEMPDLIDCHGQVWKPGVKTEIKTDARTQPRFKPSLNTGGKVLDSIEAYFYFFLPEEWTDLIMKYTNPLMDGRDDTNKKLTRGELLRFFGYMLSLSVHRGIPLHKMWSRVAAPDSTMAAPAMGRFGMTQNRFDTRSARASGAARPTTRRST